ncbi:fatty acid-binding protein 2, liver-like [Ptychodera flava]|uniref:fatty acid-binding protein 2, liver-like n=1 Tax=Ptychodera flava TaxID=63121 RepID=UPI003969D40B
MAFAGKWTLDRSENLEAFMDAVGAPEEARAKAREVSPVVEMIKNGDVLTIKMTGKEKTVEQTFKLGEPFDETYGIQGNVRKAVATAEGQKLVIKGVGGDSKADQIVETREIVGDQMLVTLTLGDVSAKRYFNRA